MELSKIKPHDRVNGAILVRIYGTACAPPPPPLSSSDGEDAPEETSNVEAARERGEAPTGMYSGSKREAPEVASSTARASEVVVNAEPKAREKFPFLTRKHRGVKPPAAPSDYSHVKPKTNSHLSRSVRQAKKEKMRKNSRHEMSRRSSASKPADYSHVESKVARAFKGGGTTDARAFRSPPSSVHADEGGATRGDGTSEFTRQHESTSRDVHWAEDLEARFHFEVARSSVIPQLTMSSALFSEYYHPTRFQDMLGDLMDDYSSIKESSRVKWW